MTLIVLAAGGRLLAYLLIYAAYRPYTDSLPVRILLGIASFGILGGVVGTATRQEPLSAIPENFLVAGIGLTIAFAILHYADRWLFAPRQ